MTHRRIGACIIGVFVLWGAATLPSNPACAQNASATDSQGLEEIVVTATRRETDLEKTPISISVLAAADIEKSHVVDLTDVTRLTPSLVYMPRGGSEGYLSLRGAIIFDDEGRVLLLEHVFRPDGGWGIPGGFLSKGEQPETALRREMREEIGIELEQVEVLFARTLPRPRQIEIYFTARAIGTPQPCSFEIRTAEWFKIDNLPADLSRDQRRLIQRALSVPSENS